MGTRADLHQVRSYETEAVTNRTVIETDADEIDPWLRYPPAKLAWADRGSGQPTGDPGDEPWDFAPPGEPGRSKPTLPTSLFGRCLSRMTATER